MSVAASEAVYRRITWRLVPFLVLLYTVAVLDRVNISFAALTMNRDLGISDRMYGFAAGVFFLTYCLFQVPANLLLARIGARRWLGMLMMVWGVVSMGTAFVPNSGVYIGLRAALGIAESGFYPGVIYYFTFWLPRPQRTRVLALFLLAFPLSNIVGSPISAHILLMDQFAGLRGWQWVFLLEGVPAVLLGFATWWALADGPASAAWLSQQEKERVAQDLSHDEAVHRVGSGSTRVKVAGDAAAYFMWSSGVYGLSFFLPKILVARGATALSTGWWATLTFTMGALAMYWASHRRGYRMLPALFFAAGMGFAAAGYFHSVGGAVASFCLAAMGLLSSLPIFWSVATGRLSGKAAGAAIAFVNSVGAVGAFAGPYAMGWLHDATHSYVAGLWSIAACLGAGALLTLNAAKPASPAAASS
ncbi:MFS transporter [Occallatibacter riparius]|uniref:MFS transporter n=1 Tax=Occallatibacter riparius TaxID=1002689 RepID=A0A9J7BYL1_9BACT|nr:MFS transporter [Occallatibacter riparius]UWZ86390.1 MFS transporter [Occallatibacter riparius]